MTSTYDPIKDSSADGYTFVGAAVDLTDEKPLSKEDWKDPLWVKFKWFCAGFGKAVLVIAVFLALVVGYLGYRKHTAEVGAIQNPPSGSPEIAATPGKTPTSKTAAKAATKTVAIPPISITTVPISAASKSDIKRSITDDGFTAEFDKNLANFESQL